MRFGIYVFYQLFLSGCLGAIFLLNKSEHMPRLLRRIKVPY